MRRRSKENGFRNFKLRHYPTLQEMGEASKICHTGLSLGVRSMKHKDVIALIKTLTGDQFFKLMAFLIVVLLTLPAATAFVLALSNL